MAEEEPKSLTYIPETVLKKRKNNEEWAIKRREQLLARRQRSKEDRRLVFKRPEQYVKEYRVRELDCIQMKHRGKLQKPSACANPEGKLLFIICISGTSGLHLKTKKILYLLRLRHIFSGVFVKANEGIMQMLQKIEPYVTYGYPHLKSVRELIFKKGYGRMDKQRVPLTDNNTIEQALGKYGILCIEDIIHEIATTGKHFKEVTSFLCPFKLNKPEGVLRRKKQYKDGGDAGNREDHINDLINRMN